MSIDPYKILGVDKKASADEIKKTFRNLARKYHPDVNQGDKKVEEKFKEISEAYDILSDPKKKAEYDNLGQQAFYSQGFGGRGYQRPDFSQGFSFHDLFGDMMGGSSSFNFGGGSQRRPSAKKGANKESSLTITFKESILGTEKSFTISSLEACQVCHGQGMLSDGGGIKTCGNCQGEGQIKTQETLKTKIPIGISNGQKIRLKGKGELGTYGAAPGDLILEIKVLPDKFFTRKGHNLYKDFEISVYDALLGANLTIDTLASKATLKIPANSQNGMKMRLKGQGLAKTSKQEAGDLYVTLKIILPQVLNKEAIKLIEKLKEEAPVNI